MDSLLRRHEEVYGWSWRAVVLLRFTKRGVALVHHHTMSRRLFFFFLFHLLLPVLWFFNLRKKIKLQQPYLTLDKDKEKSKQRQRSSKPLGLTFRQQRQVHWWLAWISIPPPHMASLLRQNPVLETYVWLDSPINLYLDCWTASEYVGLLELNTIVCIN